MKSEENTKTTKKKAITKAICVIIAILLMAGIAFVVANNVHNHAAAPASTQVKTDCRPTSWLLSRAMTAVCKRG